MTYYIYHIPNVKIGCSTNPKRRLKQQGYSSFEILETHDCIDSASVRERQLQKEYGYPIDKILYKDAIARWGSYAGKRNKQQSKAGTISMKKRWKDSYDKELENQKKATEAAILVNSKSVLQYDLKGNYIKEFKSLADAERSLNLSNRTSAIWKCCNQLQKTGKGFIWKYKD